MLTNRVEIGNEKENSHTVHVLFPGGNINLFAPLPKKQRPINTAERDQWLKWLACQVAQKIQWTYSANTEYFFAWLSYSEKDGLRLRYCSNDHDNFIQITASEITNYPEFLTPIGNTQLTHTDTLPKENTTQLLISMQEKFITPLIGQAFNPETYQLYPIPYPEFAKKNHFNDEKPIAEIEKSTQESETLLKTQQKKISAQIKQLKSTIDICEQLEQELEKLRNQTNISMESYKFISTQIDEIKNESRSILEENPDFRITHALKKNNTLKKTASDFYNNIENNKEFIVFAKKTVLLAIYNTACAFYNEIICTKKEDYKDLDTIIKRFNDYFSSFLSLTKDENTKPSTLSLTSIEEIFKNYAGLPLSVLATQVNELNKNLATNTAKKIQEGVINKLPKSFQINISAFTPSSLKSNKEYFFQRELEQASTKLSLFRLEDNQFFTWDNGFLALEAELASSKNTLGKYILASKEILSQPQNAIESWNEKFKENINSLQEQAGQLQNLLNNYKNLVTSWEEIREIHGRMKLSISNQETIEQANKYYDQAKSIRKKYIDLSTFSRNENAQTSIDNQQLNTLLTNLKNLTQPYKKELSGINKKLASANEETAKKLELIEQTYKQVTELIVMVEPLGTYTEAGTEIEGIYKKIEAACSTLDNLKQTKNNLSVLDIKNNIDTLDINIKKIKEDIDNIKYQQFILALAAYFTEWRSQASGLFSTLPKYATAMEEIINKGLTDTSTSWPTLYFSIQNKAREALGDNHQDRLPRTASFYNIFSTAKETKEETFLAFEQHRKKYGAQNANLKSSATISKN